jgi:uncharacterized protein with von Willebrand factor type A (vWA) domain
LNLTMPAGEIRTGQLADQLIVFGRALRKAGVLADPSRLALAQQAALCVGLDNKQDLSAALEAVLIAREEDRGVFRELFNLFFKATEGVPAPEEATPDAPGVTPAEQPRPRVLEALSSTGIERKNTPEPEPQIEWDASMTSSRLERLRQADFNALDASEYQIVQRMAREIAWPIPWVPTRRHRPGGRGSRLHWHKAMQEAARTEAEILTLPRWQRLRQPLPVLILMDISGSMERYARLLLAFLHAATRKNPRRDVFAFGTDLTDLTDAFDQADPDDMLNRSAHRIHDFAAGTRLGQSLASLRKWHARRLVGRRTVVLLITDGLDTGEPEALSAELDWLKRRTRSLLWLNPLLRFDGYAPIARGAAVLHQKADAMLAVHNLSRLQDLAQSLNKLLKS